MIDKIVYFLRKIHNFIRNISNIILGGLFSHIRVWPSLIIASRGSSSEESRIIFFNTVFSMLAKMTKADGQVTQEEILAVQDFIGRELDFGQEEKKLAILIFRNGKSSATTFQEYAREYYKNFSHNKIMIENMIDVLLAVAYSDNNFCFHESMLLSSATTIFHISRETYERLKSRYSDKDNYVNSNSSRYTRKKEKKNEKQQFKSYRRITNLEKSYQLLGCKKGDSLRTIKRKYRKLVFKYHPDRLMSQGLPKEFLQFSKKRFIEIQAAYELVVKHY